ncbi:putative ATP-dependent RNA helicase DDX11 [Chlorella sorokiniana]|uniref:ATP-dependent RNA helicase DDX11 n=1 Tax=Chlorella sorokiniana TaxID=3076 RepID=A0A2P6TCU8_CHLSO|nr:putative ATP-dependent RNA helicase DDX11 [Chlorella sorokiniana]|eukprot:PRW20458.1 putative ATP-dependent RNA helicase DDX11 [Chlorella sorokiniana]
MAAPAGGGSGASGQAVGRADFPAFPYPPYDIQLDFMSALYSALEAGGVGLFESPTGTGKTLSLICASLQWLHDQRQREAAEAAAAAARAAVAGGDAQPPAAATTGQAGAAGAAGDSDDDAPDWMRDFGEEQERQRQQQLLERQQKRIARAKAKLLGGGGGSRLGGGTKPGSGRRAGAAAGAAAGDPDAEFLMEDWQSDGEEAGTSAGVPGSARKRGPGAAGLRLGLDSSGSDSEGGSGGEGLGEGEEVEVPRKRQIIFASRTHSQLTQFVGELHRTPFADEMSLVALGSRKALCINEAVLALGAPSLINERCLDLQKPGSSGSKKAAVAGAAAGGGSAVGPQARKAASGRCPYLASGSQAAATTRDMILAHPIDIEELAKLGRRKSVCPYYSARRAVPEADIILAPYSCLLVKETREALGLRLEGNVVIVDEGHNLVGAINSSHAAELPEAAAATAHRQLSAYFQRFQSRLAPGNCRHIQTLARCAQVLSRAASGALPLAPASAPGGSSAALPSGGDGGSGGGNTAAASGGVVLTVNDFLLQTGLDNLNLFKLVSYVRESKAVYKIAGFWQAEQKREAAAAGGTAGGTAGGSSIAEAGGAAAGGGGTGPLHALVSFLQALTSVDADGRIVVQPPQQAQQAQQQGQQQAQQAQQQGQQQAQQAQQAGGSSGSSGSSGGGLLKFVLLNAAAHFGAVVSAAHAVVLASGTLSPLESVLHLFPGLPPHRLHRFACGHVVARERLLALAVGAGPSGAALDFRHAARGSAATMDELGRLVLNACQVVPGGVVVFFPSFSYADQVYARWQASGLLRQLAARKRVFREPRSAGEVEACLADYAACIEAAAGGSSGGGSGGGSNSGGGGGGGSKAVATLGSAAKPSPAAHAENSSGNHSDGRAGGKAGGSGSGSVCGAAMLCVVGGKLAEGINFGDALGRCVIMVGLPYPNPSDPELQERMRFMDRQAASSAAGASAASTEAGLAASGTAAALGGTQQAPPPAQHPAAAQQQAQGQRGQQQGQQGQWCQQQQGPQRQQPLHVAAPLKLEDGREYYSNLCMKAVNQCIGRVIRHRGDWASVLLVDARYAAAVDSRGQFTGPLAKLPGWIQQSLQVPRSFGDAFGKLARFSRCMAAAEAGAAAAAAAGTTAAVNAPAAAAAAAVLAPG